VGNEAPVRWAEEPLRRNLRRRILAQAKACEPTQNLDATAPRERILASRRPCPRDGKRHRQVICRAGFISEAGKRSKLRGIDTELEAVTAAIGYVCLDPGHPGNVGVHDWLPSHGSATARKPSRSTRA
jgi:hypothetical protein